MGNSLLRIFFPANLAFPNRNHIEAHVRSFEFGKEASQACAKRIKGFAAICYFTRGIYDTFLGFQ